MTKKEMISFTTKQLYKFLLNYGYYKADDVCMIRKLKKQLETDPGTLQAILLKHLLKNRAVNDPGHGEAKNLLFLIDDHIATKKHAVI